MLADADQLARNMAIYTAGVNDRDATALATHVREFLKDQAELESARRYWGPKHPGRMELEDRLSSTLEYLQGYLPQKLAEARQREISLQKEYARTTQEADELIGPMTEIDSLKATVTWFQEQLQGLLAKMANVDMAQDGPGIKAEVTDEPVRALKPVSPSLRRAGLVALVAGLGLGLAAVYVLDTLDDRFRSVEEMQAQLRVPVMAIVRRLPVNEQSGPGAVQVYADPDAPVSEAFRTLRTALSLTEGPSRQIVVTSTEPGDGKTTVMVNLAAAVAQSGKKTLLIDADLRRPGLTGMLNLRGVEGLSGVVRAAGDVAATAKAYIRPSGIEGLDVLPSGPRPGNPAELLANPRFSELLAWAESVYDQVVIDSPPALAASDAALIGRLIDGVVLVVDPAKNRRRLVLRAGETFSQSRITLLGLVVNRIGADGDGGYYEYGADYQSEYGYDDEEDDWEQIGRAA
jgi:capsular exopolysaccharide synthesis family protein